MLVQRLRCCRPTACAQGDFSGLVNAHRLARTGSTLRPIRAEPVTAATRRSISQYNVVNGNQLQLPATRRPGTTYTPFPGNKIPQNLLDPAALKALKYMPPRWASTSSTAMGSLVNYVRESGTVKQNEKRYTIRIDHNLTDKEPPQRALHRDPDHQDSGYASNVRRSSGGDIAGRSRPCLPTPM